MAPIARALRIVSGALAGRHRQERDLALAGGLDELERRLEHVLVVAVDDGRAARSSRPSGPRRSPPDAGSGTGLVEDDDAHEPWTSLPGQPPLPSSARATTSRWICWVPS